VIFFSKPYSLFEEKMDHSQGLYDRKTSVYNVFCINLTKSTDRRQAMEKEFDTAGLAGEFIKAVDRMKLDFKSINYDKWLANRCYCTDRCTVHRRRKLRPVEIAISLSHRKVYQKMIDENIQLALVCEDDIVFHRDFKETVNRLLAQVNLTHVDKKCRELLDLTSEPVIVFFGGRSDNPGLKLANQTIVPSTQGTYSNYCYLLNLAAARVLEDNFFPINRPEDSYKRYLIGLGLIKAYQVRPSLVGELSAGVNMPAKFNRLSR